jgi:hypothetical protein
MLFSTVSQVQQSFTKVVLNAEPKMETKRKGQPGYETKVDQQMINGRIVYKHQ